MAMDPVGSIVGHERATAMPARLSDDRAWQSVALLILVVDLYAYGAVLVEPQMPLARGPGYGAPRSLELSNQDPDALSCLY